MKTPLLYLLAIFSLSLPTSSFAQGGLTPPGPPAPTMKSLDQIEPRTPINATNTPGTASALFRISQPGSYYLTGNISGQPGKDGIQIDVANVNLDLKGFALLGTPTSGIGISITLNATENVVVANGMVRDWGSDGIFCRAKNTRFENLVLSKNGASGSGSGLSSRDVCAVVHCNAVQNSSWGINLGETGSVIGCVADENGIFGISTTGRAVIHSCNVRLNTIGGIASGVSTITACSVSGNGGAGIVAGSDSTVSNCAAVENQVVGIEAGETCRVIDCVAERNRFDGIKVGSHCLVSGNSCSFNGSADHDGAGIHLSQFSLKNRLEGNHLTRNFRGIWLESGAANNLVIRNSATDNFDNYGVIPGGNSFGPIVTGANIATSTNPHANFAP